ncbi:MAG: dienelactone hydrolase family protein [Methanomicrobiales archaeon]|nr:dienelactone hydrolase family protein [Methanomicrobiales archaeon]
MACIATAILLIASAGCMAGEKDGDGVTLPPVSMTTVNITADGREYPAFLAVPAGSGKFPAIVLLHSFNGLEPGYREMVGNLASDGFVTIAPEWQTYGRQQDDATVEAIVRGSLAYLASRPEADMGRVGLTGFCAGGRYTMLFLPRMTEFRSGVAWYGFPYNGATEDSVPASRIPDLQVPMLIIHGTRDVPSPIRGIYNYTTELDAADKYFEMKVYQGKPHGFMIVNGSLAQDDASEDAYREMVAFFRRTLT